jgi:hypothetical protein
MVIESGSPVFERAYWAVVLLACVGFSAYFVYDGAIGWPNANRTEGRVKLKPYLDRDPTDADLDETPTRAEFERLKETRPESREAVQQVLGKPDARKVETLRTVEYFSSGYGLAIVPYIGERVDQAKLEWITWYKNKDEVQAQFAWALVPLLFAIYPVKRLHRALTLRVRLDDHQIVYAGKVIPYAAITGLRDYNRKGWIDLYYRDGESTDESRQRLDNQIIAKFDAIVDHICQVKGYVNPVKAAESERANPPDPTP